MASLADLASVYAPGSPAGFSLADIATQRGIAEGQSGFQRHQILRNFSQFDLPDLINSQAARGAFRTSATANKANRLATGASDSLAGLELGLSPHLAGLASNALLAQTGIRLGGY